jgi:Stress responsive A/B Barrel Domain
MLIHSVYFWLKPGLTPAGRRRFRAELGRLAAIRTVGKVYIGAPAALAQRPVTERGFDFALTIVFRDAAAHDAYQVDPVHEAFVKATKASWARVRVFDSQE